MHLSSFLSDYCTIPNEAEREITRIVLDSRQIEAQGHDLFFAINGSQQDGRQYIPEALSKGVAAIVFEGEMGEQIAFEKNVPLIPIPNLRQQLAYIAAKFYQYPSTKLRMIGVTGTNGKTSCAHFIAQILAAEPCAVFGTLGNGFLNQLEDVGLTTPDAITIQRSLAALLAQGAKAVAMEVSSHSIDQGRINGIHYEVGLFTNLTQDHLDYHGTMANYAAVKKRFMVQTQTKQVVINADDAYGQAWIMELASTKPVFAYSTREPKAHDPKVAMIFAKNVERSFKGIEAEVHTPWGTGKLILPLLGEFNLSNALAVITTLCLYGLPLENILASFMQIEPPPGRMQRLGGGEKPLIVIDYACTPDALEKALQTLRMHIQGKLICVFGCGGNRDQGKRLLMGKIAENLADHVIVTNDNPRYEDPKVIAEHILSGCSDPKKVLVELNRSKAIEKSIQWAKKGDCILLAGKGAERYQYIGQEKIPFHDATQVQQILQRE